MSRRSSNTGGKVKGPAPAPDIYVGLMFVAVASLLTGIIFLVVELNAYQWQFPS